MTTQDEARLRYLQVTYENEAQDLREKLAQKKAKLKAAEARIRGRISARERKLRTRRLILMGSYLEHVTQDDPERKARLMKELDGFPGTGSGPGAVRSTPEGSVPVKGMYLGRRFYRQVFGWWLLIPVVAYTASL